MKTSEQIDEEINEGLLKMQAERKKIEAELRRDRWEVVWSILVLVATVVIAGAAVCTATAARSAANTLDTMHKNNLVVKAPGGK